MAGSSFKFGLLTPLSECQRLKTLLTFSVFQYETGPPASRRGADHRPIQVASTPRQLRNITCVEYRLKHAQWTKARGTGPATLARIRSRTVSSTRPRQQRDRAGQSLKNSFDKEGRRRPPGLFDNRIRSRLRAICHTLGAGHLRGDRNPKATSNSIPEGLSSRSGLSFKLCLVCDVFVPFNLQRCPTAICNFFGGCRFCILVSEHVYEHQS